jgi:predicted secreted protein
MEQIYVVSHCLLNPEVRVKGIKKPTQMDTKNKKIIQLPCPETIYFGINRRENTRDQFDFPKYRRFCQKLFQPYADMIEMLQKEGHMIIIVGVPKSPSCGALTTSVGSKVEKDTNAKKTEKEKKMSYNHEIINGKGIFIEEIEKELKNRQISYEIQE